MIVDSLISSQVLDSITSRTDQYQVMVYPLEEGVLEHVMSLTVPGKTVFLFSGGWRLDIDAVFLELRCFRDCEIHWHPKTLFVEPQEKNFYQYVLNKLQPQNFIILHSDYWTGHRPLADVISDLEELRKIAPRVIFSLPLERANFNKLTTSVQDLCNRWPGLEIVNNSLVITR